MKKAKKENEDFRRGFKKGFEEAIKWINLVNLLGYKINRKARKNENEKSEN